MLISPTHKIKMVYMILAKPIDQFAWSGNALLFAKVIWTVIETNAQGLTAPRWLLRHKHICPIVNCH